MDNGGKRIGEMNGRWAMLFRILMVAQAIAIPLFAAWMSWITVGQVRDDAFRGEGDRYTPENARVDGRHLYETITAEQRALHEAGRVETMALLHQQEGVTQGKLEALSDKVNVVLLSITELRAEMRARDDRND